jgi:hypothetical protein
VKSEDLFTNIPFFVDFEIFHVKFEFKFCGRITVTFSIDTPWMPIYLRSSDKNQARLLKFEEKHDLFFENHQI